MDVLPLSEGNRLGRRSTRTAGAHDSSHKPPCTSDSTSPSPQKPTTGTNYTHSSRLALTPHISVDHFLATTPPTHKPPSRSRTRLYPPQPSHMSLHQSTCLHIDAYGSHDESDLWILPDFDEWEADAESSQQQAPPRGSGEWAPLLARAVSSNQERLRRRLEGDGWDFVGGKYGADGDVSNDVDAGSGESVDEEFDVVVLPMVEVSC